MRHTNQNSGVGNIHVVMLNTKAKRSTYGRANASAATVQETTTSQSTVEKRALAYTHVALPPAPNEPKFHPRYLFPWNPNGNQVPR